MDKLTQEAYQLFGINLSLKQVTLLKTYERELLEWNQKFNPTAIRDVEGIRRAFPGFVLVLWRGRHIHPRA